MFDEVGTACKHGGVLHLRAGDVKLFDVLVVVRVIHECFGLETDVLVVVRVFRA